LLRSFDVKNFTMNQFTVGSLAWPAALSVLWRSEQYRFISIIDGIELIYRGGIFQDEEVSWAYGTKSTNEKGGHNTVFGSRWSIRKSNGTKNGIFLTLHMPTNGM
jgi:hypothetical protein